MEIEHFRHIKTLITRWLIQNHTRTTFSTCKHMN